MQSMVEGYGRSGATGRGLASGAARSEVSGSGIGVPGAGIGAAPSEARFGEKGTVSPSRVRMSGHSLSSS